MRVLEIRRLDRSVKRYHTGRHPEKSAQNQYDKQRYVSGSRGLDEAAKASRKKQQQAPPMTLGLEEQPEKQHSGSRIGLPSGMQHDSIVVDDMNVQKPKKNPNPPIPHPAELRQRRKAATESGQLVDFDVLYHDRSRVDAVLGSDDWALNDFPSSAEKKRKFA